jgi:diguanylate cyclase (GGDEF)-like protein
MNFIKKIPPKIWAVILLSYILPFFIVESFTPAGIREMRWFFFIFPVFFFAYYFGLRGGVISSLLSNAFFLFWECMETAFGDNYNRPAWETYLVVAISLVSISIAIGIGLLANKLSRLSVIDPLTSLYNRRYVEHFQLNKKGVVVFFIDLDRFKLINDSLGHRTGDKVLQIVANRLKNHTGEDDIVIRFGGDEFVFILPNLKNNLIKKKASEILHALSLPYLADDSTVYLTASIGIVHENDYVQNLNELIENADMAMYRAKQRGKNRYQYYAEEMNAEIMERMEIEKLLHTAIEKQAFVLHYQPRINLKTNRLIGMEALIRIQHPQLGIIPPGKFIPIAEETGMIIPIGDWVLYSACKQNKEWQDAGFTPLRVSVNISPRQFNQGLIYNVKKALEHTGLAPKWLELEITESLLIEDVEGAVQILNQLKDLGVYISVDDFGTGYSSLSYLTLFQIDCLKIDQSFVKNIKTKVAVVKSIIALGQSLNLEVIAEGIEEEEQASILLEQNCYQGQGYLFNRPVPEKEFEQILISGSYFQDSLIS